MKLKLISPDGGAVVVPALALLGMETLVEYGQEIDVPDDMAGAGPYWRAPVAGDDLEFFETKISEDGKTRSIRDLGHGLLAQDTIWTRVSTPGKSAE